MIKKFSWENIDSKLFRVDNIENKVNADKLFACFLLEVERSGRNSNDVFTVKEIVDLIPVGTAGIINTSTYGYSVMSMLGSQKSRDYFIFENPELTKEFKAASNNKDRDNYYWRRYYLGERCRINPKYIKSLRNDI